MKTLNRTICTLSFFISLSACFNANKEEHKAEQKERKEVALPRAFKPDSLVQIDLTQDLSTKSLQELRLLRNLFFARQGFCFMQADLRGYFTANMKNYDSLMNYRWGAEEEANGAAPNIKKLSTEELAFIKKIETLEAEKKKQNFTERAGVKLANIENVVNLFQFNNLSKDFVSMLDGNNFAIVPADKMQLFHTYEENDYHQVPNFITTDLYLQLYHMYFSYLLKSLEQHKFIPILTELSDGMYVESMKMAASASDDKAKSLAEFTAVFYAIPYYILTGEKKPMPVAQQAHFEQEIAHITAHLDVPSGFLESKTAFPYSLYKPRGHYTRSEELKKYFKAMMWLQTASFCRDQPEQLKRTSCMAHLLSSGKSAKSNKTLLELYNSIYEPIVFLIGEPDNLSVNDIVGYLRKNNLNDTHTILSSEIQGKIDAELKVLSKTRNKIRPKIELSCPDKINFMPQRYLFDNEILQKLADVNPDAKRPYPKGLDIFATLGNTTAEKILLKEYNEEDNWKEYPTLLKELKTKFRNYDGWDKTVYNKWIQSLVSMQKIEPSYPSFMQTDKWARKNLNTSLASWTDLKHDAILYGEQPEAAECGGGGPPRPYTVGYVEPNVNFWKRMSELLDLTQCMLSRNGLFTTDMASKTKQLKEGAQFLLSASEKELKHEKLSIQEYNTIEYMGASTEYLTLSIIEPDKYLPRWEYVQGPDRSVAIVADVYTRNVAGSSTNGILHEGVGTGGEIYVVVEIDGYLYLTKGSTFSYYEFVKPLGTRLTDEEWQKILDSKKYLPPIPKWMEDIVLPSKDNPKVNEKIFYSSGC